MGYDLLNLRNKYLRCICAVYMAAFCSLYLQIPGLYGEQGILPAHTQMGSYKNNINCLQEKKTLLCLAPTIGLNITYMMDLLCIFGLFLSIIGVLSVRCCSSLLFGILWALYLSLFHVGQTFLWFQWDTLLLDVGFLTIFVAPALWNSGKRATSRDAITMWVVRWALFRLMFASGVVKLQSGCPTWWGLTALDVHYESQCIPTPVAWFAHQLPAWWNKLCVAATLVIEIPVPFLFFSPVRAHRLFAFYCQLLLQVMIILSGNYNFFNALTVVLCLSLLDDGLLGHGRDKSSFGFLEIIKSFCYFVAKWAGFGVLAYYTVVCFNLRVAKDWTVLADISFSREQFDAWLAKAVPFSAVIASFSLLWTISRSLLHAIGGPKKVASVFSVLVYSTLAFLLFGVSLVPYLVLHPQSQQKIWPSFRTLYESTSDLNLASSYGLFRHMTGVGGRPEVILEGADSREGPWVEYDFLYKPGKLDRPAPFVAPHQPRVDWQMWFAALGTYHQNPWLTSMVYRLLQGEKSVTRLLHPSSAWIKTPPKYIRGVKYLYHYTSFQESSKDWWRRELQGEYLPTYTVDYAPLLDYLRRMQLIDKRDLRLKNKNLAKFLDTVRKPFHVVTPHLTMLGMYVATLVVHLTGSLFF